MMQKPVKDGYEHRQHSFTPTNCCRHAVLRSSAMAVSIAYMIINLASILAYALFIVYCSIVFESYEQDKLCFLSYIFIGVLLLGAINITFDSLLLCGVRKAKRKLVLSWVVWYGIFTTVVSLGWLGSVIVWIWLVITLDPSSFNLGVFFTCVTCLLGLFILPSMWFCFACVTSHLATLTPDSDQALISILVRQNTRFGLVNLPPKGDPGVE